MDDQDDVEEENRSQDGEAHFARACAIDMRMDMPQEPFGVEIYRKNNRGHLHGQRLCEPVQAKCTWTFHKNHFVWKVKGKMPDDLDTTLIEHRALTPTVRAVATLLGE